MIEDMRDLEPIPEHGYDFIANVSGSVFPCFTEGGEIFAIAESHSQAVRIAKDRYGEDIPDEMLAAIIDEWEIGKHYR